MEELIEHKSGNHSHPRFHRYKFFPLEETLGAQPTTRVTISECEGRPGRGLPALPAAARVIPLGGIATAGAGLTRGGLTRAAGQQRVGDAPGRGWEGAAAGSSSRI